MTHCLALLVCLFCCTETRSVGGNTKTTNLPLQDSQVASRDFSFIELFAETISFAWKLTVNFDCFLSCAKQLWTVYRADYTESLIKYHGRPLALIQVICQPASLGPHHQA